MKNKNKLSMPTLLAVIFILFLGKNSDKQDKEVKQIETQSAAIEISISKGLAK